MDEAIIERLRKLRQHTDASVSIDLCYWVFERGSEETGWRVWLQGAGEHGKFYDGKTAAEALDAAEAAVYPIIGATPPRIGRATQ